MEEKLFECSNCEDFGETSFSSYQNLLKHTQPKICIKNLPEGLTERGVENIALLVGKPLSITFNPARHVASVEFESWREVELAVQHLDSAPPYFLKVEITFPELQNVTHKNELYNHPHQVFSTPKSQTVAEKEESSDWRISERENLAVIEEPNETNNEEITHKIILKSLNYDPSLRMRQRKLDFNTESHCISYGRGYLYMGDTDRFVGGLNKFEICSKTGTAKNQMNYYCENCEALTTKCCKHCCASYCSKDCLNNSDNNHSRNCNLSKFKQPLMSSYSSLSESPTHKSINQVPLTSNCTVVIATYLSMKAVFVRRCDKLWEEKFSRLINDTAIAALKGKKLTCPPKKDDLVIAKYYKDSCYYRARVSFVTGETVQVFFIDFGNSQETNIEDIKPLPDHLKSAPAFAVKVYLKDVPDDSSIESVNYFNKLTSEIIPLILKFDDLTREVTLIEKESKEDVNETAVKLLLPSWKKNESVLLKSGQVYSLTAIKHQPLEIGKTYDLFLSHFNEQEFFDSEVLWMMNTSTDEFYHSNCQMRNKIKEYCEFLEDDCYLPREHELCLAKEKGKWHRCANLKNCKTTCCLFFLDDGHSSLVETKNIRKMIEDFLETPAQAICCTLPDDPKLKTNKELQTKAVNFLKESVGCTIVSVRVLKQMGDAYCLSIPEINKILE